MGILQILQLLPILIQSVEMFLPGVNGTAKWATVWKIVKTVSGYPAAIMTDLQSHNTEKLFSDVTAILVEAANANNIFHHSGTTGPVVVPPASPVNKGA